MNLFSRFVLPTPESPTSTILDAMGRVYQCAKTGLCVYDTHAYIISMRRNTTYLEKVVEGCQTLAHGALCVSTPCQIRKM